MRKLLFTALSIVVVCSTTFAQNPNPSRLEIPEKWVKKIKKQLVEIENKGWGKIEPGDLMHGHLILKEKKYPAQFNSLDEVFKDAVFVLYHSDEMLHARWSKDDHLPPEQRRPRSIVAYWDGTIVPAASLMKNPLDTTIHFRGSGSIHSDELATERQTEWAFWRERDIKISNGGVCTVNLIVDVSVVFAAKKTANMHIDDRDFTVTMACKPWFFN